MNILMIAGWTYPDAEGGSYRAVFETAKGLSKRGHRVLLLTQKIHLTDSPVDHIAGIEILRYRVWQKPSAMFFITSWLAIGFYIFRLSRAIKIDVIYGHHLVPTFGICLARWFYPRLPLVFNCYMLSHLQYEDEIRSRRRIRWMLPIPSYVLRWMERRVLKASRRIIVYSQFVKGLLSDFENRFNDKVEVVFPGVDLEKFQPNSIRKELHSADRKIRLLTVRRLESRMGLETLIDAVGMLRDKGIDFRLEIIGRGPLEKSLNQKIVDLSLQEYTRLLGYLPDLEMIEHYQNADLFILPTRALEGFGLVTTESLACGTLVAATPVGASPEILRSLSEKLIFKDESARAIADGIECIISEGLLFSLSPEHLLSYVQKKYSWDRHCERIELILQKVVNE